MNTDVSGPQAIVFDFSRVILFPKDPEYLGSLNSLHRRLQAENLEYPFFEHFRLNEELLEWLKNIKSVPLYIFTSGYVQEAPALQPVVRDIFQTVYSAERLGVHKSGPEAYLRVCHEIGLQPPHVLIIDDSSNNLDAARRAGLQAHHFTGNIELQNFLRQLGF